LNNYSDDLVKFVHGLKPQQIIFSSIPAESTLKLISTN